MREKCYPLPSNTRFGKFKDKARQTFLGDLLITRRFRAYGVGLERTGTAFLARVFGKGYRASHEPDWQELVKLHAADGSYPLGCSSLEEWIQIRDRTFRLEFESSHLLGPIVPELFKLFPESRFVVTIRHPKTWLRSVTDWQLNKDVLEPNSPWRPLFDQYYDTASSYDTSVLEEHGLYTLDGYLRHWSRHYQRILQAVPSHRVLLVKTPDLSQSLGRIAEFIGVDRDHLGNGSGKSNQNPERHAVLDEVDAELLEEKIQHHCGNLLDLYFWT